MDTIDAMNTYVKRTGLKNTDRYAMRFSEVDALCQMAQKNRGFDALLLAFRFGRAKGYRMAKKELSHGKVD